MVTNIRDQSPPLTWVFIDPNLLREQLNRAGDQARPLIGSGQAELFG
jgi:hypothetical protein